MANEKSLRDPALQQACREAMSEVLETMSFEPAADEIQLSSYPEPDSCVALVQFDGSLTGTLRVALPRHCRGPLAAGFLGREVEDLTEAEKNSLVAELGNMLCGATMSRLEPAGRLRIQQPVLTQYVAAVEDGQREDWLRYPLDGGDILVSVRYGES
jgi:CheY-specific phosphatase CheX